MLAFAFTWALVPFARTSVVAALLALLGPAAAAVSTAALIGTEELRALRTRVLLWRVAIRWYVLALLLPVAISALRSAFESLCGAPGPIEFQPITALGLLVFILVAGEEVGSRGFALPRLLARFGPWRASAMIGLIWALWHLPLFYIPSMPQYGTPFASYIIYLIALSIVLTFLAQRTRQSVIIATLFHGAVNTFAIVNAGAGSALRGWGNAISYGVAALLIGWIAWKAAGLRNPWRHVASEPRSAGGSQS